MYKIFISSSADLRNERKELGIFLSNWLGDKGFSDFISPYLWEEETDDGDTLDHRISAQEQIPNPSDDSIILTITMFGERCGVPLAHDFKPEYVNRLSAWQAKGPGFGFVPDWPTGQGYQAHMRLLEQGSFPLTGTIYETLSACANATGRLIAGYVANVDIDPDTRHGDVIFNRRRLLNGYSDPSGENQRTETEIEQYKREKYGPQTLGLLNCLKRMAQDGRPARRFGSAREMVDTLKRLATDHLSEKLKLTETSNPFPGLAAYRIEDPGELPGLAGLGRREARLLINRFLRGNETRCAVFRGPSGCGKSSFLQKGVLAPLIASKDIHVSALTLRPTELKGTDLRRTPLDVLLDRMELVNPDIALPSTVRAIARDRGVNTPAFLAGKIAEKLRAPVGGRKHVIVFGLDQFEEIIDQLDPDAREWWELLAFLDAMHATGHAGVLATMESLRFDRFRELCLPEASEPRMPAMWRTENGASHLDVSSHLAALISEIISEPFAGHLTLDRKIVEELKSEFEQFTAENSGSKAPSALPLLSLCLQRLYDRFSDRIGQKRVLPASAQLGSDFATADDKPVINCDDIKPEDLKFGGLISDLANEAWIEGGGGRARDANDASNTYPVPDPSDLDSFFLPLVAATELNGETAIRLTTAPRRTEYVSRDKLTEAFKKRRLLVSDPTPERVRIVHKAVLDHWKPGRDWLASRQPYLVNEDIFRSRADLWAKTGAKVQDIPEDEASIADAGQVLAANIQVWTVAKGALVANHDRNLVAYAKAVFSKSVTPMASVSLPFDNGATRKHVHDAASHGMDGLIEKFLSLDPRCAIAKSSPRKDTPLHKAAWNHPRIVEMLLPHMTGAQIRKPDQHGWHAISGAINAGNLECFELLLPHYSSPNAIVGPDKARMLNCAASWGRTEMVRRLLCLKADPSKPDKTGHLPLHWAAAAGHLDCLRLLMPVSDLKAIDTYKWNVLHFAVSDLGVDILQHLLSSPLIDDELRSAMLTAETSEGLTPLGLACINKHAAAVRVLLRDCNPNAPMMSGRYQGAYPLHLAMTPLPHEFERTAPGPSLEDQRRASDTVRALLASPAIDPNVTDKEGHRAESIGLDFVDARELIRADDRFDWQPERMPPADLVRELNSLNKRVVRALLAKAPDLVIRQFGANSGLDLVLHAGHDDVVMDLVEKGRLSPDGDQRFALTLLSSEVLPRSPELLDKVIEYLDPVRDGAKSVALAALAAISYRENGWTAQLQELIGDKADPRSAATREGTTLLHMMAKKDDLASFAAALSKFKGRIPIDNWRRLPSDLCATALQEDFRRLEKEAEAREK